MSKRMTYRYYAKLLTEKRITLDEIPNKYKDDVLNYIENGDNINKFNDNPTVFDQPEELLPAENLDEITALIRMKYDKRDIHTILNDDVFNSTSLENIDPSLVKYEIDFIENYFAGNDLNVTLNNIIGGCELIISGTPKNNVIKGTKLFRIDLQIDIKGYEIMRQTVYFEEM